MRYQKQARATIGAVLIAVALAGCGVTTQSEANRQADEASRNAAVQASQQAQIDALKDKLDESKSATPSREAASPASNNTSDSTNNSEPQPEPTGSDRRIPESGSYAGWGEQRTLSGTRLDKGYSVEMTFSGGGSTVRYPALGCSGRLRPNGFSGDARVYVEEISVGHCDDGGTWKVTVRNDAELSASYSPRSGKYIVVADLAS